MPVESTAFSAAMAAGLMCSLCFGEVAIAVADVRVGGVAVAMAAVGACGLMEEDGNVPFAPVAVRGVLEEAPGGG